MLDKLAALADTILDVDVTGLAAHWEELPRPGGGQVIVSDVNFGVREVIKASGSPIGKYSVLGGTINGHTMVASDFTVPRTGNHLLVFLRVKNGRHFQLNEDDATIDLSRFSTRFGMSAEDIKSYVKGRVR